MKRKLYSFLAIFLVIACMITMVGCEFNFSGTTTNHNYSNDWTSNDTAHWHECIDDGCTEISDYAEHTFDTGVENNGSVVYTCTTCQKQITISGYTATFVCDDNVSVVIYDSQDVSGEGSQTTAAYARDGETGSLLVDGNGQINFKVVLEDSYAVSSISITGAYNKIKNDPESDGSTDYYRITKVASNLTINITTTLESEATGYSVTFDIPEGVTVTVFDTQDITGEGTNVADGESVYAKTSAGVISKTGAEQVNFVISVPEGYEIDTVTAEGTYNKIKADPEGDGSSNYYRITKITSDVSVSITIKEITDENNDDITEDYDFDINYISGTQNAYSVVQNDNGEYTLTFNAISSDTVYQISGTLNGNIVIDVGDNYKFELELCGITITSEHNSPIVILSADKVTLTAKNGYVNNINDNRAEITDDEQYSSAIYSVVDLTLGGQGTLNVVSTNNKGIHTKDDLEVKKLTLNVTCKDNALKGNDSVTISSGILTLIASQGDGIKTSNSTVKYYDDGVTVKKIQGTISITGGTINIYSACDGIDAAYNVEISGTPTINIWTDKYSEYSEEVTNVEDDIYYIRSTTTSYKYSIYYYNSSTGDYVWKNSSSYKSVNAGMGRTYYYYQIDKPSGYTSMTVYVYSSSQSQGQSSSYVAKSSSMTLNSNYDTIAYSTNGRTGTASFGWTNYGASTQGGPGGMNEGNPNKGDYSTKGIKADNEILISGGTIYIKSYDDCIHTNNDVVLGDEDDANDDYYGTGNIVISGGTLTLYSCDDAIHADQDLTIKELANITVTSSYEGLEANRIFFNGGTVYVYATNDAANAATCNGKYTPLISMTGGYVDLATPSGDTDTMDSNGNITISAGTLVLKNGQTNGTSMTGGTLDLDGTLSITGGNIISIGCWCQEASMSSQASSTSTTLSSGTYTLKNSSGTEICSFTLSQSYKGYRIYCYGKSGTYYLYNGTSQILSF